MFNLTQFTNLVIQLERDDIQTVDALFVKMLGDQSAAKMAVRLLYWFPKAKKIGGWVYKSWRDWGAELGLSPAQVKRVHHENKLEDFGFVRRLMKANGAPTTHYLLDFSALLDRVAAFVGLTVESVRALMGKNPAKSKPVQRQNPAPEKRPIYNEESAQVDEARRRYEALMQKAAMEGAQTFERKLREQSERFEKRFGIPAGRFAEWVRVGGRHVEIHAERALVILEKRDVDLKAYDEPARERAFTGLREAVKHNVVNFELWLDKALAALDDQRKT